MKRTLKLFNKKVMGIFGSKNKREKSNSNCSDENEIVKSHSKVPRAVQRLACATPFVTEMLSAMFIDEDGDVADEFYKEVKKTKSPKACLVKVVKNLKPQGLVRYDIPRLNPDLPYVMVQVSQS